MRSISDPFSTYKWCLFLNGSTVPSTYQVNVYAFIDTSSVFNDTTGSDKDGSAIGIDGVVEKEG